MSRQLAATALLFAVSAANAGLINYGQDFEGFDQSSPSALADDGWLVFGTDLSDY